jgi:hypothetical protein
MHCIRSDCTASRVLGDEHSDKCLVLYDFLLTEKDEKASELMMLICGM